MEYPFCCGGSGGLAPQAFRCESMPTLPVIRYYCLTYPVTLLYMEYAFCCWEYEGLAPKAFRCESMPTPLNLTHNPSYDCPWFLRMRNSFTSVDLSTCQPVNLSPVTWLYMEFAFCCRGLGAAVVNHCLLH